MASASPYYPPRSRWYGPLRDWWYRLGRRTADARNLIQWPGFPIPLRSALWSLAIPGYVFHAFGHGRIGLFAMAGCGLGWMIFFVWLGSFAATVAFALILSLHVTSISFLSVRTNPEMRLTFRILATLGLLAVLTSVYGCFRDRLNTIVLPMRIGAHVVVVHTSSPSRIQRGEWIAHRVEPGSRRFQDTQRHGAIHVAGGYGLARILGQPGDTIRFLPDSLQVNGRNLPRERNMPASGEIALGEKQWFAWPRFAIHNRGIPETELSNVMLAYSIISEDQFVGKPFKRWFGRRQILP